MLTKKHIFLLILISTVVLLYYTYSNIENPQNNYLIKEKKQKIQKIQKKFSYDIDNFINTRDNVYFDISIDDNHCGRIEIELFDDEVPNTAKNFRYLCSDNDKGLNFKNNCFHRVIPGYLIQGGDILNNDGTGGFSAYGKYFPDENFNLDHNQEGILSMANCGKNKNNSQFFILTRRKGCKEFDKKYVVFGIIIRGYDIIKKIERCSINRDYTPKIKCEITNCGIIKKDNVNIEYDMNELQSNNPIKITI